ncbi:MAG: AmmeMemoRadiSam system protein B [Bacteroidales bacterium]|nr:AmmeMemoRadiSam system protein B [Bacteroidales bacterium]
MIGGSHTLHFEGASVYSGEGYKTPLGVMKTDATVTTALQKASNEIGFVPQAHRQEHSLEVQMPFIQHSLGKDVPVVPAPYRRCRQASHQRDSPGIGALFYK